MQKKIFSKTAQSLGDSLKNKNNPPPPKKNKKCLNQVILVHADYNVHDGSIQWIFGVMKAMVYLHCNETTKCCSPIYLNQQSKGVTCWQWPTTPYDELWSYHLWELLDLQETRLIVPWALLDKSGCPYDVWPLRMFFFLTTDDKSSPEMSRSWTRIRSPLRSWLFPSLCG